MKLSPDDKRRVVLPLPIPKGDILLLDEQGHNQWLLTRIERPKRVSDRKLRGKSVADALARSAGANARIPELKGERLRGVNNSDGSQMKFTFGVKS
jgi:hypothetical protein